MPESLVSAVLPEFFNLSVNLELKLGAADEKRAYFRFELSEFMKEGG